ncbi:DUF2680 domain-containing protein [Anaeroselena agilis]|uniref:DUF2680 domain-containing protein n=1 Tax=Anaeroselena agilis TaxID=3063788 RepID=A0ABU3NS56_9FIRM|nr:DUF2680 domain-containing protein [Selenomonadales bacterium 4137-cl]
MKKALILSVVAALVVVLGASFVSAAAPERSENSGPMMNYDQMQQMHQQMVDQHVKDGFLTQEQAQAMNEHMSGMSSMMKDMGSTMNGGMMGSGSMMGGNGNGMMGGSNQK